jgi:uncharacterized membrane protein YoaK (UPF0700 family)
MQEDGNVPDEMVVEADNAPAETDNDGIISVKRELTLVDLINRPLGINAQPSVKPPKPPLQERNPREFLAVCLGGTLLTLNAGFINSVTMLISGVPVSHVTGTVTRSAISIRNNEMNAFFQSTFMAFCFIVGSALTASMITSSSFHLGRQYNRVFLIGSIILSIGCVIHLYVPESFAYVYCVAMACGMQNAMTTRYSNNILRTTHLTGTATDIGVVIGHILTKRRGDLWKLYVLLPMLFAFFIGGLLGAEAFYSIGHGYALFLNLIIFGGTGILYVLYLAFFRHLSIVQAIFLDHDIGSSIHRDELSKENTSNAPGVNTDHFCDIAIHLEFDGEDELNGEEDKEPGRCEIMLQPLGADAALRHCSTWSAVPETEKDDDGRIHATKTKLVRSISLQSV